MLEIKKKCCDQCLFTKNKIVSDVRKDEIIKGCMKSDTNFICHKSTIEGGKVCCRGFYEKSDSQMLRIAGRLNMIEFVD